MKKIMPALCMCNNMDCTNVAFTGQCGWYTVKVHIGVLLHIPI